MPIIVGELATDEERSRARAGESPALLTAREHRRLADVLLKARRERRALRPFILTYPELTLTDARRVRDAVVSRCVAAGERAIGAKAQVAGSGEVLEESLGLLTSGMMLEGDEVDLARLIRPRVEAKLALVLDAPGNGKLSASVVQVLPSLEVVDSRYEPGHPSLLDDVADSYGASFVRIGPGASLAEIQLDRLTVALDGIAPTQSLPFDGWQGLLGGETPEPHLELGAGSLLLSPALASSAVLSPGTVVIGRFGDLGELRLRVC